LFLRHDPRMTRRASRRAELFAAENARLLAALGECRRAILQAQTCLKPSSDVYRLGSALLAAIDALATRLTGDPEYFWTKPHSTGQHRFQGGRE
jgi:hypothetical protein